MQKLLARGSYSTKVKSVYPTLTYVIHSSYVTGTYPSKHGVYHNNPFQPFVPEKDQEWHWYRGNIKGATIYEALHHVGYSVCALLWPVSGKGKIRYNIPEIRAIKNENQALKILKNGSPLYSLTMELRHGKIRQGIAQPYLDDFTTACIIDTIKTKRPNLLLAHLIDLDDTKHLYGTKGPQIPEVIERMDHRLGEIMQAVDDAGMTDHTTFLIIGDHSQLEVRYKIHFNRVFQEHGLIYEENGVMKWRAYIQAAGGAANLFIQPDDTEAEQLALKLILDAIDDGSYGIEALYDRNTLDAMHVAPKIPYMLEAKEDYCFDDRLDLPTVYDLHAHGKKYATHGYLPDKPGYTSMFLAAGANIKQGVEIGDISVIDLAPTIAHLFGVPFQCDGRAITEIMEH